MSLTRILTSAVLLSSLLLAHTQVISGSARIIVLKSDNWQKVDIVKDKVGCVSNEGRFIEGKNIADCGIFTHLDDYPYTLSSQSGNCTFNDQTQEVNKDSHYGGSDHAWFCSAKYVATVIDGLYTITGFPYPFLCSGDIDCYFDAKRVPKRGEDISFWQFRWGSQQQGITPGHIQLQLLWDKVSPPHKAANEISTGPVAVTQGSEFPLKGKASELFKA